MAVFYTWLVFLIKLAHFWVSGEWLGQPETALWAVIIVTIWKEAGFFMIFYLVPCKPYPRLERSI